MLLTNLKAATMRDGYGLIEDAAVLVEGGRIAWVGPRAEAPAGHDGDRLRGPPRHARPHRLPHPPRLWRQPGP